MMPVIAWNALHASTILGNAMKVLTERCVTGIQADEARCRELLDRSTAVATALSPYIGYAATADIAKTAVKTGRSIADIVRERQADPRRSPGRDPVAGGDDLAGHPGIGSGRNDAEDHGLRARLCWRSLAAPLAAQHARLFPPENLGLLEGPDRDAWQRPEQIMDALQIGESSVVADLGAGGGWFTVRLARRVG